MNYECTLKASISTGRESLLSCLGVCMALEDGEFSPSDTEEDL